MITTAFTLLRCGVLVEKQGLPELHAPEGGASVTLAHGPLTAS